MNTATPTRSLALRRRIPVMVAVVGLIASIGFTVGAEPANAATVSLSENGLGFVADDANVSAGARVRSNTLPRFSNVTIPSHVTIGGITYAVTSIGDSVFLRNSVLSVSLPDTMTTIGRSAFEQNSLTSATIPPNVETIGERAFANNRIDSVTIPNSVETIGALAFFGSGVKSVQISTAVTELTSGVFGNNRLTSVTIPNGVTAIGSEAFSQNPLTSVTIPDSVTTIGATAFRDTELTAVHLPDSITTIGIGAFWRSALTSVSIPSGITRINEETFRDNQLTSISIPEGVTEIGDWAFSKNQLTSVTLPSTVTRIGDGAFAENPSLSEMRLTGPPPQLISNANDQWLGDNENVTVYFPGAYESIDQSPGYTTPDWLGYQTVPYYTVSFDGNGGGGIMPPQENAHKGSPIAASGFTRADYTFVGWNTSADGTGTPFAAGTEYGSALRSDVTLYAMWAPMDYAIAYDLAGGVAGVPGNPDAYSVTSDAFTLTAPTREGYTFAGWTGTALTETTQPVTVSSGSTGDRSYIAVWSLNDYTIAYELDGGVAGDPGNPGTYSIESEAFTLTAPTRDGYTFIGWDGTGLTETTASVTVASGSTGHRAYTASWALDEYAIAYDLAGGAAGVPGNPDAYSIESDAFTLSAPTREGYTFVGWTGTALTETTQSVTVASGSTGGRSYSAVWSLNEYTIAYDLDAGLAGEPGNPSAYSVESDSFTLTAPTRDGYSFAGWTGTGLTEATQSVTITAGSTGNLSYTAIWSLDEYTIAYDLDGGVAGVPGNLGAYSITSDAFTLTAPTRDGYSFAGWTGTGLTEATQSVTITAGSTGNLSYTAIWSLDEYTIAYDLDGGVAGVPGNLGAYSITSDAFTLTAPTRDGYSFAGWTGTGLTEATQSVTITAGSTGDRSYTAIWSLDEYTIAYDLDGGLAGAPENPGAYSITSDDFTLTAPTRDGYTFAGWIGTGLTDTAAAVTVASGSTGDRSYTALWTLNEYMIAYDLDGGVAGDPENPSTYSIESDSFTLTAPTRDGYTFSGWDGTGLTEATASVTVAPGSTGDRSYTAVWSVNPVAGPGGNDSTSSSPGLVAAGSDVSVALIGGVLAVILGALVAISSAWRRRRHA